MTTFPAILVTGARQTALRSCYTMLQPYYRTFPTLRHADGLAGWLSLGRPRAHGVLACRVAHPQALRPDIRAVPWHLAW